MRCLTAAAAMLAELAAASAVRADNSGNHDIVCWSDDRGGRSCGDHVPPQYAQRQREVYDRRGVLIRTLNAEQTPQQRAEQVRRQLDAQSAAQQQRNDSFLLQTYGSVDELQAARDNRLQSFDLHIELAEKALRDGAASLKELQGRADAEHAAGAAADSELLGQIKSFEGSQTHNIGALAQVKRDRDAAAARFDGDIVRYQELRGAAAPLAGLAQRP